MEYDEALGSVEAWADLQECVAVDEEQDGDSE